MRIPIFAFALLAAAAAASEAAPLAERDLATFTPGSELRGDLVNDGRFESHVWRFSPDGSVSAVYLRYSYGNFRSNNEDRSDLGRWWVAGSQLCVHYRSLFNGVPNCFVVDAAPGLPARFIGHPTFVATWFPAAVRYR
jgi:hypothetical protein